MEEKAKISIEKVNDVTVCAYLVEGFVEDGHDGVSALDGTVAFNTKDNKNNIVSDFKKVATLQGDLAARWLLSMEDEDGSMPLYADPLSQTFGRIDWVRLACTAHALFCYGKATHNEEFQKSAKRTFFYILKNIFKTHMLSVNEHVATLTYLARTAMVMEERTELLSMLEYLLLNYRKASYEPILVANLITLFTLQAIAGNQTFLKASVSLAEQVFVDFETRLGEEEEISLALYAELAHSFSLLHIFLKEDTYAQKAESVKEWLVKQQFVDGAFPAETHSSFSYSRGVGKIFEALAGFPALYEKSLYPTFYWLARMQYTEHNTYFVDPSFRKSIIGGLRHDHANTEAWVDGAAHFLLGISRIVSDAHDQEI